MSTEFLLALAIQKMNSKKFFILNVRQSVYLNGLLEKHTVRVILWLFLK